MTDSSVTKVITVSSIFDRDKLIKNIYTQLTIEPQTVFTITKDQINRIRVYHNVGVDIRVLIRTYVVIIIPVIVDISPLDSILGVVDFNLDETINSLQTLINRLQSRQGRQIVKGNTNAQFKGLLEGLSQRL